MVFAWSKNDFGVQPTHFIQHIKDSFKNKNKWERKTSAVSNVPFGLSFVFEL
jgi:hypothetical protein